MGTKAAAGLSARDRLLEAASEPEITLVGTDDFGQVPPDHRLGHFDCLVIGPYRFRHRGGVLRCVEPKCAFAR